jgi:hypothetical protein
VNFLARRSLQSVDISGPALFRSITKWQPTFIVDEADDALANNPDLRSVINSDGRAAKVSSVVTPIPTSLNCSVRSRRKSLP